MSLNDFIHSKTIGVNNRLKNICNKLNIAFSDYWDMFYKPDLHTVNGKHSHLNSQGQSLLADKIKEITENWFCDPKSKNIRRLQKTDSGGPLQPKISP